jgi:hypothetical protein
VRDVVEGGRGGGSWGLRCGSLAKHWVFAIDLCTVTYKEGGGLRGL